MSLLGPAFNHSAFTALYHKHRLLTAAPRKAVFWELAIFLALLFLFITMQGVFGVLFAFALYGEVTPATSITGLLLSMMPAALLIVLAIWGVIVWAGKNPVEFLNLRKPELTWLGWILVLGAFCAFLLGVMVVVEFFVEPQKDDVKDIMLGLASSPQLYLLAVVSAVVGAPLAEEFLFRGYLFGVLAPTRLGYTGSIVVTSAVWALMHAGTASFILVTIIFILGCALGYLLVRFGSLWVCLVCHGVWNLISSVMIYAAGVGAS